MKPLKFTIYLAIHCVVATFFVTTISGVCNAAPQELLGKSIVMRGTATYIIETPEGKTYPQRETVERVLYISTRGRVFERNKHVTETSSDRNSEVWQGSPDDVVIWHFKGNNLGWSQTDSGAHAVHTISFDASFRTCHYSAHFKVFGPIGGQAGLTRFRSITLTASSCAIQEGNAFAD